MNVHDQSPKSFGQILDQTFRLSKRYFKPFFLIILIFTGPVYLLQALIELGSGVNFISELGGGESFIERLSAGLEDTSTSGLFSDFLITMTGLISLILTPLAAVSIMHGVRHINRGESFSAGDLIKRPFSRFWPIVGSSVLFGLILFGIVFVPLMLIIFVGVFGAFIEPVTSIIFALLMGLGVFLGVALLAVRWGFYLGPVAFENDALGLSRSWHISKRQTWKLVGIFLILFLITGTITSVLNSVMTFFMGFSVLQSILTSLLTLILNVIMYVGYAVVYFDLKVRNDADDLKDMIADYETSASTVQPDQGN